MKKKTVVICVLAALIGLAVPLISLKDDFSIPPELQKKVLGVQEIKSAENDIATEVKTEEIDLKNKHIKGGIIPHDIRFDGLIIDFFRKIENQETKTIILLVPDHLEQAKEKVVTSGKNLETPLGELKINKNLTDFLGIEKDDITVEREHAIKDVIPYIKKYFPESEIVPLVFKNKIDFSELEKLSQKILQIINEEIMIVAAVDFSHYLSALEAEKRDLITAKALDSFDYQTILSFQENFNEYLDSPSAMALFLMVMKEITKEAGIIGHSNSGYKAGDLTGPTTSYFEVVYY